jgi:lipoprotein-anchoring transpeptidase ErfK/SrfK
MLLRTLNLAAAALALAAALGAASLPAAAQSRYAERPPVQLDPDLAAEWILQLSPGSGVVPGYVRPDLTGRVRAAPAPAAASGVVLGRPAQRRVYGQPAVRRAPAGFEAVYGAAVRPSARTVRRDAALAAPPATREVAPRAAFDPKFLPQTVAYEGGHAPGTIVVDTAAKFLYLVEEGGQARRYGVGVGKEGFGWNGTQRVSRKAEWPTWTPPAEMRARERRKGRELPVRMEGGPENPLGARALYLGSTLYRIHGTNQPWTIGRSVSSGCIRMRNEDVMDLYDRVPVGAKVVVS